MSLAPAEGRPVTACPECAVDVGIVRVDAGGPAERELLVDLEPRALAVASGTVAGMVWVEMFSGHPPRADVLPVGMLHSIHRCYPQPRP